MFLKSSFKKIICITTMMLMLPGMIFAARPGLYIGLTGGQVMGPNNVVVDYGDDVPSGSGTITGLDSDVYGFENRGSANYSLIVGYTIIPYVGLEANFTYLGSQDLMDFSGGVTAENGLNGNLSSFSYGLSGVAYLPFYYRTDFAKLGVSALHSKVTVHDPQGVIFSMPGSQTYTTTNAALTYGLGAQYYFNRKFTGRLEWDRISRFNDGVISNISYNQFEIGLTYYLTA